MRRAWIVLVATMLLACACRDDRVRLVRGPLGPAAYRVDLSVSGRGTVRTNESATLNVARTQEGATLTLAVAGADPIVAELRRVSSGKLELRAVAGVDPTSAGEADLASIVTQLDPPLPGTPIRLRQRWSATRRVATETLEAVLIATLEAVGFARVGDTDALMLRGTVRGRLQAVAASGTFQGTVTGTTTVAWALRQGRLASSETELRWTIPEVGAITVRTVVRPQ